jgi:hypothetical protein
MRARDAVSVRANKPDWRCTACRQARISSGDAARLHACTRQSRVCQSVNGARHPPGRQPTNQPARRVCSRRCSGAAFAPTFMSEREHSIMLICEAAVFSANQYGTQLECYSFTPPRERPRGVYFILHVCTRKRTRDSRRLCLYNTRLAHL